MIGNRHNQRQLEKLRRLHEEAAHAKPAARTVALNAQSGNQNQHQRDKTQRQYRFVVRAQPVQIQMTGQIHRDQSQDGKQSLPLNKMPGIIVFQLSPVYRAGGNHHQSDSDQHQNFQQQQSVFSMEHKKASPLFYCMRKEDET